MVDNPPNRRYKYTVLQGASTSSLSSSSLLFGTFSSDNKKDLRTIRISLSEEEEDDAENDDGILNH